MEDDSKVIIDVQVDGLKAAQDLASLNAQIGALKAVQKQLTDEIKAGSDEFGINSRLVAENEKVLKQLQAQAKSLTGQLQTETRAQTTLGDSFVEMQARATQLEKEYKALTAAQRDSEGGKAMKAQLIEVKQQLKDVDAELGNHQRNVGNYPQVMGGALSKVEGILQQMGTSVQQLATNGFGSLTSAIGSTIKQAVRFIATPLGAVLTVIAGVLAGLASAFKKSDDAGTSLARGLAAFKPITQVIGKAFEGLALVIGKAADAFANLAAKISDSAAENIKAVERQDALEEAERQYTRNHADREAQISKLREESADKEAHTAEERVKLLDRAIALETADLAERRKIAKEKLDILDKEAQRNSDTSDETKNKISEQYAAMKQAEKDYNDGVRRLQKERATAVKENNAEIEAANKEADEKKKAEAEEAAQAQADAEQAAADAARAAAEEAARAWDEYVEHRKKLAAEERQLVNALEDATLEAMEDGDAKRYAQKEVAIQREIEQIEELYQQLVEEQPELQETVNALIAAKWKELADYKAELDEEDAKRTEEKLNESHDEEETNLEQTKKYILTAATETGLVYSAFSDLVDQFAGSTKSGKKAAKAFALAQIATSEAISVAKSAEAIGTAVASATEAGASTGIGAIVATPAFIAELTGVVLGALATTIGNITQAKSIISGGSFQTGGVVPGTSFTGDNVVARVNSGEMILNADQQAKLFEVANGGLYASNSAMFEGLTAALSAMPSPVLVYSEFQAFQGKTARIDEATTI